MARVCAIAVLAVVFVGLASAQGTTAQLTGVVTDPSGAGVPGARITVVNIATGDRRAVSSGRGGAYLVPLLPPGTYKVTVEKEGFRQHVHSGIPLEVNQSLKLDFALQLGQIAEAVEVTAEAALLEQETSALGEVIENRRIEELPLNGRNIMSLMELTAGVQQLSGLGSGFADAGAGNFRVSNLSINGGRGGFNAMLLDGSNNAAPERGEVAVTPSVEAVQEFKVYTTGAPAEFGRTSGGVITLVTKSGTNALHGSAYEFLRNETLDARNSFAATRAPFRYNQFGATAGGPVILPRIYNGRNRTFFFVSYEGWRLIEYQNRLRTVPTDLQRAGDFSRTFNTAGRMIQIFDPSSTRANPAGGYVRDAFPGNRIPQSRFDPISSRITQAIPGPNRAPINSLTNAENYGEYGRRTTANDQWVGRFDHNLSESQRLSYRLAYNRNTNAGDTQFGNFLSDGPLDDPRSRNYQQAVLNETHTLNAQTFGELRAGYVSTVLTRRPPTSGADVDRLGYPAIIPRIHFPQHTIDDFGRVGGGQTVDAGVHTISAAEAVTHVRGRHTLKFGGEAWTIRRNRVQVAGLSGQFNFGRALTQNPQVPRDTGYGVATFLLGAVSGGVLNVAGKRYDRGRYYAFFAQDDWRATRRLTLNLGLRYELQTNSVDRYNRRSSFNLTRINPITGLPGVLDYAGVDYGGSPVPLDRNNLGPRFGFAWTVDRSESTVLRGAYGIYYQSNFETFDSDLGWSAATPFTDPSIGPRPIFLLSEGPKTIIQPPGNTLGPAGFLGSSVRLRLPTDRVPYIQQWNFGLQRALPGQWALEAVYSGSKGTRLTIGGEETGNFNQLRPQYLALGFDLQTQVPNPMFDRGIFGRTVARSQLLLPYPAYLGVSANAPHWGSSIYHSFQLTARKRMSQGYSILLSYTNAKLIDDLQSSIDGSFTGVNQGVGGAQNAYNRRAERSLSPQADISQRLVISHIVELPFGRGRRWLTSGLLEPVLGGWQLTGVTTFSAGQPLAIRGAQNFAADRPDSSGRSAKLPDDRRSRFRWFDTAAFAAPPLFTYGNVGRVLPDVRVPGVVNFDAGLQKLIRITERFRVQVRGEAFNLTNRVNLGPPDANFISNSFGVINSTSTPARIMQVGVKVSF